MVKGVPVTSEVRLTVDPGADLDAASAVPARRDGPVARGVGAEFAPGPVDRARPAVEALVDVVAVVGLVAAVSGVTDGVLADRGQGTGWGDRADVAAPGGP
jgi:hypothetical protein